MTTICLLLYMLIKPWSRIRSLGWMARDRIRSAWTARTFSSIPRWFSPLKIRNAPFSPHFVPHLQCHNLLKLIVRIVDTLRVTCLNTTYFIFSQSVSYPVFSLFALFIGFFTPSAMHETNLIKC